MSFTLGTLEYGAYNFITSAQGSGSSSVVLSPANVPAGKINLIVVAIAGDSVPSVVDSQGNTYSYGTTFTSAGLSSRIAYCVNPTTAAGMTITPSSTALAAVAMLFMGKKANPTPILDQQNGANTNGLTLASGNITPTDNGELLVATSNLGTGTTAGYVPTDLTSSGWSMFTVPFLSGSHQGIVVYYKVQPAIASDGLTFGGTNVKYFSAAIASFKN